MSIAPDASYACAVGKYCPQNTSTPLNCPAGYYRNATGARALSDCAQCPAGFWCVEGASNTTGPCAAGFYCPLMSTGDSQVPCPQGTQRPTLGGRCYSSLLLAACRLPLAGL
jgi:hypothetical protein